MTIRNGVDSRLSLEIVAFRSAKVAGPAAGLVTQATMLAAALLSRSERRLWRSERRRSPGGSRWPRSTGSALRGCLALFAITLVTGCGRYPPVGSSAYELAESVAGVCNARREAQLPAARQLIADRHAAGEITRREEGYLLDIIEQAERGDWERAERRARRLLLDQSGW